jgi:hypothetical protein
MYLDPQQEKFMSTRTAAATLIAGTVYTVVHKFAYALVPSIAYHETVHAAMSVLWLLATGTLLLFAYRYVVDLSPRDPRMRTSLIAVMVCTAVVMCSHALGGLEGGTGVLPRIVFRVAGMCNAAALVGFTWSFLKLLEPESPLRRPTRAAMWCCGIAVLFGLISLASWLVYVTAGTEAPLQRVFAPIAQVMFLVTSAMTVWFLMTFRRVPDLGIFAGR